VTLRALIFDVDGTLADTEEAHRRAFNGAFARHGYNWHWEPEQYRNLLQITGGRERIAHFIRGLGLDPDREGECLAEVADLHGTKTALYSHAVREGMVTLRPGVARLLRSARRAGLALAIATTTSPGNVNALISATLGEETLDWFGSVVTGDRVLAKKPDPEAYRLAVAELGLEPAACIAFEDSANGLAAATAARLRAVVTPCQWTRHERFPGALRVLPHLGDPSEPLPVEARRGLREAWLTLDDLEEVLRHAP
jgi:HAD superfamily hydrolase (TIGR01509 family)